MDDFDSGKNSVKDCFELYENLKSRLSEAGFKQDLDSLLSSVFGTLKSVARCYLALSSLGLKTACLSVYVALAVRAHICTCNRELCFLVNIGLLPRVIGSDPLIC